VGPPLVALAQLQANAKKKQKLQPAGASPATPATDSKNSEEDPGVRAYTRLLLPQKGVNADFSLSEELEKKLRNEEMAYWEWRKANANSYWSEKKKERAAYWASRNLREARWASRTPQQADWARKTFVKQVEKTPSKVGEGHRWHQHLISICNSANREQVEEEPKPLEKPAEASGLAAENSIVHKTDTAEDIVVQKAETRTMRLDRLDLVLYFLLSLFYFFFFHLLFQLFISST